MIDDHAFNRHNFLHRRWKYDFNDCGDFYDHDGDHYDEHYDYDWGDSNYRYFVLCHHWNIMFLTRDIRYYDSSSDGNDDDSNHPQFVFWNIYHAQDDEEIFDLNVAYEIQVEFLPRMLKQKCTEIHIWHI